MMTRFMGASSPSTTFTVAIGSDCKVASDLTAMYIKMYEIGHDGIQCEFLPPFDLKVSLVNSPIEIKFTVDIFSILFLLDKLRNLGMDGLQVTQSCLEHTT